ncbi:heparanase [Discoglossus pictus]
MIMYLHLCLVLIAGAFVKPSKISIQNNVQLKLNLESSVRSSLDPRFLSVTIDASLASEPKYIAFLSSQKLITLTRGLSPAYLRFGGTKSDFLLFDPLKNASLEERIYWDQQHNQDGPLCDQRNLPPVVEKVLRAQWPSKEQLILKEYFQNSYRNTTITKSTMDLLYKFANCSGLHLIFGLNALLREGHDEWNNSNAKLLIDYCSSKRYNMSWELGNEPNSFRKKSGIYVDGSRLGKDFVMLHNLLSNYSRYRNSGLFGPDIGQPKKQSQKMLKSFLSAGGKIINSVTWHHYYVDGRSASKEDFLNPDILDTLISEIQTVFKIVDDTVPGKLVWLGETSSAYGGGSPGLSNTYLDGFMWLDKLGVSAKLGIGVVMRQALFGAGSYNLVDSDFEPLPDYWLSLLYKKLVGSIVLNASVKGTKDTSDKKLRVYIHCTNNNNPNYSAGDVTLFVINLYNSTQHVQLPGTLSGKFVDEYLLEPAGKEGLLSKSVLLNGKLLKMVDEKTLPTLHGKQLDPGSLLVVPALRFSFYVVRSAQATACL